MFSGYDKLSISRKDRGGLANSMEHNLTIDTTY